MVTTIAGFLLIIAGFLSECFFWRRLCDHLATNMQLAGYASLLLASAAIVWVGMGLIGHGFGVL